MRRLFLFALLLPLCGQAPPEQQAPPSAQTPAPPTSEAKAADTKPADNKAEAASPVPSAEAWFAGSIDLGYRFRTDVAGSFNTYRSFVNLGEGPKLLGAEFTITDPKSRLFDTLRVRASSFGDEPYQTLHLEARKAKLYDFRADYRDLAYFNFLPSYADPLLARGITLDEQSFDTRRKISSFALDLLPGNWFVPYVAYDRDAGSGTGASVFVSDGNEYPVPNRLSDLTNLYRAGVRFELRHFHATIEEGGTTFKDDQSLFTSGTKNLGNVSTPVFGQTLFLNNLLAAYGIRGSSKYSKGLLTANPLPWLDLYGQFLFSQPESDVNYQQTDAGNIFSQTQLLFFSSQQYLVASAAKLPHTSASVGFEVRPYRRVRILDSWLTDRLHNAGSSVSTLTSVGIGLTQQTASLLASSLASSYNQNEINLLFEATHKLTFRTGYRYVWGSSRDGVLPLEGLAAPEGVTLRRKVGIGGITYHPNSKLSVSGDMEIARSTDVYFRTSLFNYEKGRARARYQLSNTLSFSADFSALNNQNPTPGIHYDFHAYQESLALLWSPQTGKWFDVQGSYTRSDLRSNLSFLSPQDLQPQRSDYRENGHTGTALMNVNLPKYSKLAPKLTAGGSFYVSSGSRPTRYYQPLAKLWLPVSKHAGVFAQWQYYGYGEAFYLYEGFRTHLFTAGLRLSR